MQCFYVLVHGILRWNVAPPADDTTQPRGFYCHRYVLASDERRAKEIAFERVRTNFDKSCGWLRNGSAVLKLEAEDVCAAPFRKLLKPDNRGHTFYDED